MKIVATSISGERYYGTVQSDPNDAINSDVPIDMFDVHQVVTMTVPMGPGIISRSTKLANPDFYHLKAPRLRVRMSSFYEPEAEAVKELELEEKLCQERYEAAKKEREEQEGNGGRVQPQNMGSGLILPQGVMVPPDALKRRG